MLKYIVAGNQLLSIEQPQRTITARVTRLATVCYNGPAGMAVQVSFSANVRVFSERETSVVELMRVLSHLMLTKNGSLMLTKNGSLIFLAQKETVPKSR